MFMLQQRIKLMDVKDRFYEELERVFDKFPEYRKKILLGDFNAKVREEDILNQQLGMRIGTKLVMS
jgi:exonuclease III